MKKYNPMSMMMEETKPLTTDRKMKDANEYDVKKIISKKRYKGHEIRQVLLKSGETNHWVYTDGDLDWESETEKEAKDFIDSY